MFFIKLALKSNILRFIFLFLLSSFILPFYSYSKNIMSLQKYSTKVKKDLDNKGSVELININPNISSWYLYKYNPGTKKNKDTKDVKDAKDSSNTKGANTNKIVYLIENPDSSQTVSLSEEDPETLVIKKKSKTYECKIISSSVSESVSKSEELNNPYTSICEDRLYIIGHTTGRESSKEYVVDFLRKNIWGADKIVSFVKDVFFFDKYLLDSDISDTVSKSALKKRKDFPQPAMVSSSNSIVPQHLGISYLDGDVKNTKEYRNSSHKEEDVQTVIAGEWYRTNLNTNVYISVMKASLIDESIMKSYPKKVNVLDPIENEAISYFVAFDLSKLDLDFKLGTEHPSLEWSTRVREELKDNKYGPDGIDSPEPLVSSGKVNPYYLSDMVATFTGGFKRNHSAFMWGDLSTTRKGHHYGFIQEGVLFSTLNPKLATVYKDKEGSVFLETWTKDKNSKIKDLKFARQNGVPIIDSIDEEGIPVPGKYVKQWGAGNWSGSEQNKQRALRAGICLQENKKNNSKYLIYGYFSSVTPNAMARLFQSYSCSYAMHLDMNALEHTYLALYGIDSENNNIEIEHLVLGMEVLDRVNKKQGNIIPRFLGMSDNRDFFYLKRKTK